MAHTYRKDKDRRAYDDKYSRDNRLHSSLKRLRIKSKKRNNYSPS